MAGRKGASGGEVSGAPGNLRVVGLGPIFAELDTATRLVAVAEERLATAAAGIDHPRLEEARWRIAAARTQLLAAPAAGVALLHRPDGVIRLAGTAFELTLAAFVWVAATLATALHASAGWVAFVAIAAFFGGMWPLYRLLGPLDTWTGRHRAAILTQAARTGTPTVDLPPTHEPRSPLASGSSTVRQELGETQALIDTARRRIGVAAMTYLHRPRRGVSLQTAAGLQLLCSRDRLMSHSSGADLNLCAAGDAISIWLATQNE